MNRIPLAALFLAILTRRYFSVALPLRWATKKAGGSSRNGRTSEPKMLGVKKFGECFPVCEYK